MRRGVGWVAAEFFGFVGLVGAPLLSRAKVASPVRLAGGGLMAGAVLWTTYAYGSIGASHSPWVVPNADATLVTTGAYRIVRHPIYAGWTGIALGWGMLTGSPLAVGVALATAVYYDRRSRVEERALVAAYPDYAVYRGGVKRLIPGLY